MFDPFKGALDVSLTSSIPGLDGLVLKTRHALISIHFLFKNNSNSWRGGFKIIKPRFNHCETERW